MSQSSCRTSSLLSRFLNCCQCGKYTPINAGNLASCVHVSFCGPKISDANFAARLAVKSREL